MQVLQHPNFSFDYKNRDASQFADTLNNLVTKMLKDAIISHMSRRDVR